MGNGLPVSHGQKHEEDLHLSLPSPARGLLIDLVLV